MVAALGALELTFVVVVGGLSILAGMFALYVLVQLFRNPLRRKTWKGPA